MPDLQASFNEFDRMVGEVRALPARGVDSGLDSRIVVAAGRVRQYLGECGTALAVQRTCDLARQVLAGGPLRDRWLPILDVDREVTRAAMRRILDAIPARAN